MNLIKPFAALAVVCSALPALAAPFTLDFEGTGSFSSIAEFYNGGTDGAGNTGTNYGASFTGAALSLANDSLGPYFSNAPTPGSVMFATDASATLNFAKGFVNYVSFYYASSTAAPSAINIYSGLDGTGAVLASSSLNANATAGCSDTAYCNFEKTSTVFAGVGKSIGFGGNTGNVAFDNVVLTAVPEPASYLLMGLGLAGMGFIARRRRV